MSAKIEKEPKANGMIFHAGVFTDENGKEFDFTLIEMYDSNIDYSSFDITFCDKIPDNVKEAEKQIMGEFNKMEE
jgi:hypothetical protein